MLKFRIRTALIAMAVIAVLVFACVRITEYPRWRQRGANAIATLQERRPSNVPAKTWEIATNWALTAYANTCFSGGHVPLSELKAFVSEAEEELSGPVDLDSIDWVWGRLAETSPRSEEYVQRFQPEYRFHVYGEPSPVSLKHGIP
ncbi:MAG: hypothetical protein AAF483_30820 [Planctomycetota bacterium]